MAEGYSRSAYHLGAHDLADRLHGAVPFPDGYDDKSGVDALVNRGDGWGGLNSMAEGWPDLGLGLSRMVPGALGRFAWYAAPVIGALGEFGRIVDEREKNNNGRPADLGDKIAAVTAAGAGAVGSEAASLLNIAPGSPLAAPLLARHLANYFAQGTASEAIKELARQIGGTAGTDKGLAIDLDKLKKAGAKGALSVRPPH
jgi:hypothetical protein